MNSMPKPVMEKFNDPQAVKVLCTIDGNGVPNVAYISSLFAPDRETLIYADTMGVKTKRNLLANSPIAAMAVLKEELIAYQVKGTFKGFETSGDSYKMMSKRPEYFFNTYFGIRAVGVIKIDEVYSSCPPLPGRRMVPPEDYLKIDHK